MNSTEKIRNWSLGEENFDFYTLYTLAKFVLNFEVFFAENMRFLNYLE